MRFILCSVVMFLPLAFFTAGCGSESQSTDKPGAGAAPKDQKPETTKTEDIKVGKDKTIHRSEP